MENHSAPEGSIIFHERQRYYRKKLWFIVLIVCVLLLTILGIAVYRTIIERKLTGLSVFNDADIALHFVFITIGAIGLPYLFYSVRLETKVTDAALDVEFWPFRKLGIPKNEIDTARLIEIKNIPGFNGYGIRENWNGFTLVVLADSTQAVELTTKSGETYIFGSKKPEELIKSIL